MKKPESSLRQMREFVARMPFNQLIGIRLTRLHKDGVTIDCRLRPELLNASGVLHGGVTATLADSALGIAITTQARRLGGATTVEMKVNYLRPVAGTRISARARILRMGSTLCIGRVDLYDDARKLVGTALVTYMFLRSRQ